MTKPAWVSERTDGTLLPQRRIEERVGALYLLPRTRRIIRINQLNPLLLEVSHEPHPLRPTTHGEVTGCVLLESHAAE
jgi:hypothetical protein